MLYYIHIFKTLLSTYFVVPLVFIVGIYLSIRLNFLQFTKIKYAWNALIKTTKGKNKGVSSFAALSAVLGGNLGTGNIAGIAFGLATGGPGSLFWMWVMAFLGSIVKFVGVYLGVKYRVRDEKAEGGTIGGPMYYLSKGLNLTFTAKVFCVVTILGAITAGNLVQVNSVTLPLIDFGISPYVSGIVMAVTVGFVLLKGKKVFLEVASKIVPLMAILYVTSCVVIVIMFAGNIIPALKSIIIAAFNPYSVAGGIGGYMVFDAIKFGFDRGLFATDAGIGLAPILHAEVTSHEKLERTAFMQGMVAIVAPIIVMVICTLTGLTLLVTKAWTVSGLESTNICIKAFQLGLGNNWAGVIVTITLWFFAFTTILTWAHCAEKSFHYLFLKFPTVLFRLFFVLFIPVGALIPVSAVWNIADITINIMLVLNLIGVLGLSKKVIKETKVLLTKKK